MTNQLLRIVPFVILMLCSTMGLAGPQSDDAEPVVKEPDAPATRVGRYEHRDFTIAVGEAFTTQRGGAIILESVDESSIVLKRTFPWTIPAKRQEYSIGNHESLRVLSVDQERETVRFRVRTQVKFSIFEAYSF
jgi:hypothetical protein